MEYTAQWMKSAFTCSFVSSYLSTPTVLARSGEGIKQISQDLYLLTPEKLSTNPVCCEISAPWWTADHNFEQKRTKWSFDTRFWNTNSSVQSTQRVSWADSLNLLIDLRQLTDLAGSAPPIDRTIHRCIMLTWGTSLVICVKHFLYFG